MESLKDRLEFDVVDEDEIAFLMICGRNFFIENSTTRRPVLLHQTIILIKSFFKNNNKEYKYDESHLYKLLADITGEFLSNQAYYYLQFHKEFCRDEERLDFLQGQKFKKINRIVNKKFSEDFQFLFGLMEETPWPEIQVFAFEDSSPPYLKLLCSLYEDEKLGADLYKEADLVYRNHVHAIKKMLIENSLFNGI